MGIYVYNRKTLDEQLSDTSAVDFGKDVFPKSLESYRVQAFPFDGYWEDIGTVHSFHEANLQMASPTPRSISTAIRELFTPTSAHFLRPVSAS